MKPVTQTAGQPDTPFWKAVESAFLEIDSALPSLPEDFSLACILAGGAAVHLYTQIRVSDGMDAAPCGCATTLEFCCTTGMNRWMQAGSSFFDLFKIHPANL